MRAGRFLPLLGASALGLIVAAVIAGLDAQSGLGTWLQLRGELTAAKSRVGDAETRVGSLDSQVDSLKEDPFALERAIREDLGFAREGEVVVRFRPSGSR